MGREIRRVPPDWEHPYKEKSAHLEPLCDQEYTEVCDEWLMNCDAWRAGRHKDSAKWGQKYPYYWQWSGDPPDSESYRQRTWTAEEATAYQVYENVSEGTPISPVLLTVEDLRKWVIAEMGASEHAADEFIKHGSAPSMVVTPGKGVKMNVHCFDKD